MYTLLIDGSGPRMGLGICREGELQHLLRSPFEAYEELTDWLMQTLKHHSIASEAVKRLGVVTGPGSYTGLRSSLLLMRTWSQTRHLPYGAVHIGSWLCLICATCHKRFCLCKRLSALTILWPVAVIRQATASTA